jgi:hypothetical protein
MTRLRRGGPELSEGPAMLCAMTVWNFSVAEQAVRAS